MLAGDLLVDGPADAAMVVVLAHGAGAPMDSPFMTGIAARLAERGLAVVRFEFAYMAARRTEGKKKGPDRMPALTERFRAVVENVAAARPDARIVIGGKSMGGRVASMVADPFADDGLPIVGVACLGYPFHPPGKPEKTRTAHLEGQRTPTLIVQGTRDPFGRPDEVTAYSLSEAVSVTWIEGGDHDLKPLKRSGRTADQAWDEAADAVTGFASS